MSLLLLIVTYPVFRMAAGRALRPVDLTDEEVAAVLAEPTRSGITVHASETSTQKLLDEHLPKLLAAGEAITADWARLDELPVSIQEQRHE